MDVVAIAKLLTVSRASEDQLADPNAELSKSDFRLVEVIKGDQWLKKGKSISTLYFGDAEIGSTFLLMGADPPQIMWSTPLLLSDRAQNYISRLMSLEQGPGRLGFFLNHLEDADEMLARDAYDEFAKAPYADVIALKQKMDHDQLIAWIKDRDVPVSRRRLYLTMLGICGSEEDTEMLELMLRSQDRTSKAGLDALAACYLMLKGEAGMQLIEELFLKNENAEYADTYSAILALRFHGSQAKVIPRERLLRGFRYMLERPQLADLVIPDLAKWEDWSVMDRLVQLFIEADESSSWVRVPVINYLRACPLPDAKKRIEELSKIDPDAVKRANTFFPLPVSQDQPENNPSPSPELESKQSRLKRGGNVIPIVDEQSLHEVGLTDSPTRTNAVTTDYSGYVDAVDDEEIVTTATPVPVGLRDRNSVDFPVASQSFGYQDQMESASIGESSQSDGTIRSDLPVVKDVHPYLLIGTPVLVGILLFGAMWYILRGAALATQSRGL